MELKAEKPLSASLLGVGKSRPIIDSLSSFGYILCWFFISVNRFDKKNIFAIFYKKNFFFLEMKRFSKYLIKEKKGVFFYIVGKCLEKNRQVKFENRRSRELSLLRKSTTCERSLINRLSLQPLFVHLSLNHYHLLRGEQSIKRTVKDHREQTYY